MVHNARFCNCSGSRRSLRFRVRGFFAFAPGALVNLFDLTTKLDEGQRYDALVSASSRRAAVEIAAEALPEGCFAVYIEAEDVTFHEGRDSWRVAIWFAHDSSQHERRRRS